MTRGIQEPNEIGYSFVSAGTVNDWHPVEAGLQTRVTIEIHNLGKENDGSTGTLFFSLTGNTETESRNPFSPAFDPVASIAPGNVYSQGASSDLTIWINSDTVGLCVLIREIESTTKYSRYD